MRIARVRLGDPRARTRPARCDPASPCSTSTGCVTCGELGVDDAHERRQLAERARRDRRCSTGSRRCARRSRTSEPPSLGIARTRREHARRARASCATRADSPRATAAPRASATARHRVRRLARCSASSPPSDCPTTATRVARACAARRSACSTASAQSLPRACASRSSTRVPWPGQPRRRDGEARARELLAEVAHLVRRPGEAVHAAPRRPSPSPTRSNGLADRHVRCGLSHRCAH